MQAFVYDTYGSPDVLRLEQVERPVAGEKQILVEVHAASVNRTDCHMLRARPVVMRLVTGLRRPRQPVLGTAFAGVVVEAGAGVSALSPGDRVFGFDDNGAACFAEFTLRPLNGRVARLPDGVAFDAAAACIEGVHYALNFFNKVRVDPGTRVLINGGGGAIGSAGVQLAKHFGAHAVAVCDSHQVELVSRLGADRVIDFTSTDFTADSERYRYVFDMVGKSSYARCRHLLEPQGAYLSSHAGPLAQNMWLTLVGPLLGETRVRFPFPFRTQASLRLAGELLAAGKLDPVIDRRYPLKELPDAFRYAETGRKTGNVVLSVH